MTSSLLTSQTGVLFSNVTAESDGRWPRQAHYKIVSRLGAVSIRNRLEDYANDAG